MRLEWAEPALEAVDDLVVVGVFHRSAIITKCAQVDALRGRLGDLSWATGSAASVVGAGS